MNDASNVMDKVRRSLGRREPLATPPVPPALDDAIVRLVPPDADLPKLFAKRAAECKIGVTATRGEELPGELVVFLNEKGVRTVAVPRSAALERLGVIAALRDGGFDVRVWGDAVLDDMYDIDAAVTDVWRAVAETGSLVVRASPEHGRSLSLVPPLHVAIVEPENLLADLIDLFALANDSGDFSAFSIISGPSKTSDIEMNLVVGVHGPEKVRAFLVE